MGRMLEWESPHELNAFRLLDANPAVTQFEEQPLMVHYMLDGMERVHYPDVGVVVDGAKELWEVKTRAESLDPETARRTELMSSDLPKFGYKYRMVIAEDLAVAPRLSNALMLLRHGRTNIPTLERERLRRMMGDVSELTWGAVLAGAFGKRSKAYVCRLVLEGALRFDMNAPMSERTLISTVRSGMPVKELCLEAT